MFATFQALAAQNQPPGPDPRHASYQAAGSPFLWMLDLNAGAFAMHVRNWFSVWSAAHGIELNSFRNNRVLAGRTIAFKTSTLWETGDYAFQQLRPADRARIDYVVLVGVAPQLVHSWLMPHAEAVALAHGQHRGVAAVDTYWLRVSASAPLPALAQYKNVLSALQDIAANPAPASAPQGPWP